MCVASYCTVRYRDYRTHHIFPNNSTHSSCRCHRPTDRCQVFWGMTRPHDLNHKRQKRQDRRKMVKVTFIACFSLSSGSFLSSTRLIRPLFPRLESARDNSIMYLTKNRLSTSYGLYGLMDSMGSHGTILTKFQTGREGAEEGVIRSGGCGGRQIQNAVTITSGYVYSPKTN